MKTFVAWGVKMNGFHNIQANGEDGFRLTRTTKTRKQARQLRNRLLVSYVTNDIEVVKVRITVEEI